MNKAPIIIGIDWANPNPDTIWNKLAARLGRQPSNAEAADEVKRILATVTDARSCRL